MSDIRADPAPGAHLAIARPAPRGEHCRNCGAELYGEFCYACGQPRVGWVRHLRELGGDFVDSVLNIDGRFLRTLVTLFFRPGLMTVDYLAGARGRYSSPFRMFFVLCALAFLLLQLHVNIDEGLREDPAVVAIETAPTVEAVDRALTDALAVATPSENSESAAVDAPALDEAARKELETKAEQRRKWILERDAAIAAGRPAPTDPAIPTLQFGGDRPWHATENPIHIDGAPPWVDAWLNARAARMQRAIAQVRSDPAPITAAIFAKLPLALLVVMPVFAAFLKLVHWPRHRLYTEHLVVALHSHAFLFLAMSLLSILGLIERNVPAEGAAVGVLNAIETALLVWMPAYLLWMQKRVYGGSWRRTLLEYAVIATGYFVLLITAITVGAIAGLMSL